MAAWFALFPEVGCPCIKYKASPLKASVHFTDDNVREVASCRLAAVAQNSGCRPCRPLRPATLGYLAVLVPRSSQSCTQPGSARAQSCSPEMRDVRNTVPHHACPPSHARAQVLSVYRHPALPPRRSGGDVRKLQTYHTISREPNVTTYVGRANRLPRACLPQVTFCFLRGQGSRCTW